LHCKISKCFLAAIKFHGHKNAQNSQKTALDSGRWSLDGLYFSDYQLPATRYLLVTPEPRSALSKRQRLSF
jgi:hypothetical protein